MTGVFYPLARAYILIRCTARGYKILLWWAETARNPLF